MRTPTRNTPTIRPSLRLLVTETCPRNCEGCCNKQWELRNLPKCKDFRGYKQIMITGGEPLYTFSALDLARLVDTIRRDNPKTEIILYTAWVAAMFREFETLCNTFDGITLTLHDQQSADDFDQYMRTYPDLDIIPKRNWVTFRLNVFAGIHINYTGAPEHFQGKWVVKDEIEWIENCPLPTNEVFMRL